MLILRLSAVGVSQSVSAADTSAEAAVLGHSDKKPGEASADGPPPASSLQLNA